MKRISKFVSLTQVRHGLYCLSHSLTQQQIFGDDRLAIVTTACRKSDMSDEERLALMHQFYNETDSQNLFGHLCRDGFFVSSPQEHILDHIAPEAQQRNRSYRLLRILLTDMCNLSCNYCKVMPNIVDVTKNATSFENLERAVKIFIEGSIASTPKIIHVSGGEPLIAWDHVQYIVELVERFRRNTERYFIVIGTNAMLVNDERAAYMAKHDVKVIASMDGREHIHNALRKDFSGRGSFEQVDHGVRILKKYGIELGLSMVVGRHNIDTLISEIGFMLDQYAPVSLGVNYMKPPTNNQKDFAYLIHPAEYVENIYNAFKTYRHTGLFLELVYRRIHPFITRKFRYHDCGAAAGTTINMNAKGNIGPCKSFLVLNTLTDDVAHQESPSRLSPLPVLSVGSENHCGSCADSGGCKSILKKTTLPILDSLQLRSTMYIPKCQECSAIGTCGNACAYEAWVQSGNWLNRDMRACNYTQLFFAKFIKDLGEIVAVPTLQYGYYVPTEEDRLRLLGKIIANEDTLISSIGHAADE